MNPDDLVKGELYQVDMGDFADRWQRRIAATGHFNWHGEIVLYLGSENPSNHKHITNHCFYAEGKQRLVDRHFLKFMKELK